jgi:prepilin-type N-terminal cleavage/methylation domain-containing protein
MKNIHSLLRRRNAFTLIELLVVMVLILVLAALGLGYVVFGQDNQHSVSGAQAVTGALLNAKQRARRDGLPTGIRILFTSGTDVMGRPFTFGSQLQLVQQPQDYNLGTWTTTDGTTLTFSTPSAPNPDFLGGADYIGEIDQSTVQAGDYFLVAGTTTPHRIFQVNSPQSLTLASSVSPLTSGAYTIIRAPRRLPSEDIIQLPSTVVIDNTTAPVTPATSAFPYCQNLPMRTLADYPPSPPYSGPLPRIQQAAEIVFAPSGAVVGQGTGNDKVYLWLRDPSPKVTPVAGAPMPGAPLILSVQFRTGFIGVYPVAPWSVGMPKGGANGDPYAYVSDPRSSGL